MTSLTDLSAVHGTAADVIHIEAMTDQLAEHGFDADTDDALVFLTPVLGPTSVLVLHRLSRALRAGGPLCWSMTDLAATFGVAVGQLDRTVDRLERFGFARREGFRLVVRTRVPPLTDRQLDRLPDYLAAAYQLDRGAR